MGTGEAWNFGGQESSPHQERLAEVMDGYDNGFVGFGEAHDDTANELDALTRQAAELAKNVQEVHARLQERYAGLPANQAVAKNTVQHLAQVAAADTTGQTVRVVREVSSSGSEANAEHSVSEEVIRKLGDLATKLKDAVETDFLDITLSAKTAATHGDEAQRHKARAVGLARS